jgi:hypothetical protein
MDVQVTDAAVDWVRSKGGTAAIDFIPPIG